MTYTIHYRDNGSMKSVVYTATDRHDLFEQLAKEGIRPVRVQEGDVRPKSKGENKKILMLLIAVLGVGSFLFVGWLFMSNSQSSTEKNSVAVKGKVDRKDGATKKGHSPQASKDSESAVSDKDGTVKGLKVDSKSDADTDEKAKTNKLDFASMTADEAAKHGYYKAVDRLAGVHPRVFKTTSEEIVAGIMCTQPGMMVVGIALPGNFDEEIKAALREPALYPTADDDDYARARKEAMLQAREIFKEAMAKGEKPSELVEETRRELRKIAELRREVVAGLTDLRQKGAPQEEIYDYIQSGNEILGKYNAQPLLTPLGLKRRIELQKLELEVNENQQMELER